MKLIIDIPEELKNKIDDANEDNYKTYIWWFETTLYCAIKNGTPIPDNATVCDIEQIRAEIDGIEINGQVDEHTMFIRSGEQVKQMALDIIDKYTKGE